MKLPPPPPHQLVHLDVTSVLHPEGGPSTSGYLSDLKTDKKKKKRNKGFSKARLMIDEKISYARSSVYIERNN